MIARNGVVLRSFILIGLSVGFFEGPLTAAERLQPVPVTSITVPNPGASGGHPVFQPETTLEQAKALAYQYYSQLPDQDDVIRIKKKKFRVHVKKHVRMQENGGCYTEDRGLCWFVAPAFLSKEETEQNGVYVVKATGKLYPFPPVDDQFLILGKPTVYPSSDGKPISANQAAAIANQVFGTPLGSKRSVEERGNCWFAASVQTDPITTEQEGVYIHKWTAKACPFYPVDARFYNWEGGPNESDIGVIEISEDQAKAIVYKRLGWKPYDCYVPNEERHNRDFQVEDKGNYWRVSHYGPLGIRRTNGGYVNKETGRFRSSEPGDMHASKKGPPPRQYQGKKKKKRG